MWHCVIGIEANAMSPAIEDDGSPGVHMQLVGDGDCGKSSMWYDFVAVGEIVTNYCNHSIGMLKSSLHAGEHFDVSIVFFFEMGLEVCHGVLCNRLVLSFVNGAVENTTVFEDNECEVHHSVISDRLAKFDTHKFVSTSPRLIPWVSTVW